jgi:hypothetical protein
MANNLVSDFMQQGNVMPTRLMYFLSILHIYMHLIWYTQMQEEHRKELEACIAKEKALQEEVKCVDYVLV